MPQVINTNISSLNAQRNLNSSQSALATSLQRLSSGLRINSAKDDAAGLAISDRMTTQIRGLTQAARNANDAISLSQTADGALSQVTDNLQRIRELAVQSANATNTSSDRTSLNAEVTQLLAEIQRVSTTSQFNGQNILDGTFTAAQFQVGANANQTITASVGNAQTTAIGSYQITSGGTAVSGNALIAGALTLNGIDVGSSTSGSAEAIAASINSATIRTGVTASALTTVSSSTAAANALLANQSLQSGDLVINGVSIGAVAGSSNVATQGANVAAAINAVSNATGVSAVANSGTGQLTLTSSTGKTIDITTNASVTADGATRVENATGLELADATKVKAVNTLTFGGTTDGVRQVGTHTATATAAAGQTITIAGKTFTYVAAITDQASQILVDNGSITLQGVQVAAAIDAAISDGTLKNVTRTSTAVGVTTLTAKANVISTSIADGILSASASVAAAGAFAQTTTGVGIAVGDTVKVGGVTYEFTLPTATGAATSGNVQVKLGTGGTAATDDDILTATNFADALSAQFAAGNSTVQFTSRASGAVTMTNNLYGSTGVVAAPDRTGHRRYCGNRGNRFRYCGCERCLHGKQYQGHLDPELCHELLHWWNVHQRRGLEWCKRWPVGDQRSGYLHGSRRQQRDFADRWRPEPGRHHPRQHGRPAEPVLERGVQPDGLVGESLRRTQPDSGCGLCGGNRGIDPQSDPATGRHRDVVPGQCAAKPGADTAARLIQAGSERS
jgi:flagellin